MSKLAAINKVSRMTGTRRSGSRAAGRPCCGDRRGNALVLAAGILALLVIIATAYVSRTQVDRNISVAQQRAEIRDSAAEDAALLVAGLIGDHLFVRRVNDAAAPFGDPAVLAAPERPASSNWPRLPIASDAVPFSFDVAYPYNRASYAVVPYTNWPDKATLDFIYPGTPPIYDDYFPPHGDGVGNPGFGDTPWLRDSEPMRMAVDDPTPELPNSGDELVVFVQWLHMSNIATAENGIRIMSDISDIRDLALGTGAPGQDGIGLPVTELLFPVEQRLPVMWNQVLGLYDYLPANTDITSPGAFTDFRNGGNPSVVTNQDMPPGIGVTGALNTFMTRWARWFFPPGVSGVIGANPGYPNQLRGLGFLGIPGNYYKLTDLDGDGAIHDSPLGDRPEDEFVFGTARHTVGRVLCDSDGDGFTDSFWFLLPTHSVAGTATIVGVSIVDNAGKLDLNVASKFEFADQNLAAPAQGFNPLSAIIEPTDQFHGRTGSAGQTPADLAAGGQLLNLYPNPIASPPAFITPFPANWNVGFLDNPLHSEAYWGGTFFFAFGTASVAYNRDMWRTDTTGAGVSLRPMNFLAEVGVLGNGYFETPNHELRTQADRLRYFRSGAGSGGSPRNDVTPFTLADEIELRQFAGQNQPWTGSRFERAMQQIEDEGQILRASVGREETNEYIDQLANAEMVRDLRDKITLFSSTRNDRLPPWLWWEPHESSGALPIPARILALMSAAVTPAEAQRIRDNFFAQTRRKVDLRDGLDTAVDPSYYETFPREGELSFHERLPYMFQLALIDFDGGGTYGASESDTKKTAAGLAANLEAYRTGRVFLNGVLLRRGDELQYPAVDDPLFGSALTTGVATPEERARRAVLIDPDAPSTSDRMVGVEPQPFILEAFIAHVYPASVLDPGFDAWYDAQDADGIPPFTAPVQPTASGNFDSHSIPCDPDGGDAIPTFAGAPPGCSGVWRRWVDDSSEPTTVVAVQIANPFTESDETGIPFDEQGIDLNDYAIRVFGRTLRIDEMQLSNDQRFLKPATEEKPRSAIFYLIPDSLAMPTGAPPSEQSYTLPETGGVLGVIHGSFKGQWKNFFDIGLPFASFSDPPTAANFDLYIDPALPGDRTIVVDVLHPDGTLLTPTYSEVWSSDRTTYDTYAAGGVDERAIEILKKVTYFKGTPDERIEWVVVDRSGSVDTSGSTENDEFTRRVGELPRPPAVSGPADWANGQFNGVRLFKSTETSPYNVCDRWVPWARMTRAWGSDFNFNQTPVDLADLGIQADERAPRFIFGREFVAKADDEPTHVGDPVGAPNVNWHSDMYRSNLIDPDPLLGSYFGTDPDRPWFKKRHAVYAQATANELQLNRKPFFFTMNPQYVADEGGAPDLDLFPDDVYMPFNGGSTLASTFVNRYGYYFWYIDQTNPTAPLLAVQSYSAVPGQPIGPPGAGVPNKGLVTTDASDGAEPDDGNPVPFRQFFAHSLQMNQKDRDFEQVGELFNLWERGHELPPAASGGTVNPTTNPSIVEPPDPQNIWDTKVTFAERMGQLVGAGPALVTPDPGPRVNRLTLGPVIGDADPTELAELNHAFPALPAGLRVFDAFVCDGPGRDAYILDLDDEDGDGVIEEILPPPATPAIVAFDPDGPGPQPPAGTMIDQDHYARAEDRAFRNAQGFSGAGTAGLVNLNSATIEVLRSLPQGAAIVNELVRLRNQPTDVNLKSEFIRTDNYLADALVYYRDCYAALPPLPGDPPTQQWEPTYAALNPLLDPVARMDPMRSGFPPTGVADPVIPTGIRSELDPAVVGAGGVANLNELRGERGFASIGELALAVNQPNAPPAAYPALPTATPTGPLAAASAVIFYPYRWRMDMLGHPDVEMFDPFSGAAPWTQTPEDQSVSASLSVDTTKVFDSSVDQFSVSVDPAAPGQMVPDRTAKDNEELNMLFSGMSNLVSTRSDTFTVYLKVRTFRQDPATGRWDATKKENILDDSRYVMLVDRSNVNKPTDKPRILYFEKAGK